ERSAGRLLGPVAAAPAEAANRPTLATLDTPDAVECFRERPAALERELVLRQRPGGEVHVRVVQPGKHDAAAKVDHVRRSQSRLVHADTSGDPVARDRERALCRQLRIHGADQAVFEDHGRERMYAWRRSTTLRFAPATWTPRSSCSRRASSCSY